MYIVRLMQEITSIWKCSAPGRTFIKLDKESFTAMDKTWKWAFHVIVTLLIITLKMMYWQNVIRVLQMYAWVDYEERERGNTP